MTLPFDSAPGGKFNMKKILVIRLSAMGDVMLLVPVLRSLVAANTQVEVTVLTRPKFASFFTGIERVSTFSADVDKEYAGVFGIRKLVADIQKKHSYDLVIDVHDHIRTILIRSLFKLSGKRIITFNKGRKEKKAFVRRENKITNPLPHTVDRYKAAFQKAGFNFPLIKGPYLIPSIEAENLLHDWLTKHGLSKNETWIGLAPFSMHTSKIWPIANYPQLIASLIKKFPVKFFLFGGGAKEISYFEEVKQLFPNHCVMVAGQLKMPQEIALMKHLDLMLCTDSSNMHLAVLSGTPLLSIWGGTHPNVGFGPFGKDEECILQISRQELPCRPCSVYGKETCHRGDFACMTNITVDTVINRIEKLV
jgi:ADP-heptose:LPS heptosyltransferase